MPLSEQQLGTFRGWLKDKTNQPQICPVCGRSDWSAGDILAGAAFADGKFNIGGQTVPMVQMICNHCAYVRLFAAVPVGLLE